MVKEYLYNKMDINILETTITMKKMEMDIYIWKMENFILDNLNMIKWKVMVSWFNKIKTHIMVNLKIIKNQEMVNYNWIMVTYMKVYGLMTN